jgi:hypothetical protein
MVQVAVVVDVDVAVTVPVHGPAGLVMTGTQVVVVVVEKVT